MGACRLAALAAGASLLFVVPPVPAARGDDAEQAKRAEALMDGLLAEPSREEPILRQAVALREECLADGNYRTAEFLAGQIADRRRDRLDERHRYQRILLARGKADRAEEDLRGQIRERPSDCAAYGMLADLLVAGGRARDAMEIHAAHLKEHAGEARALEERAYLALYQVRDPDSIREAIAALRAAGHAPGTSPERAAWFEERAGHYEGEATAEDSRRRLLARREGLLDALLAGTAALFIAAGLAVRRVTRQE